MPGTWNSQRVGQAVSELLSFYAADEEVRARSVKKKTIQLYAVHLIPHVAIKELANKHHLVFSSDSVWSLLSEDALLSEIRWCVQVLFD